MVVVVVVMWVLSLVIELDFFYHPQPFLTLAEETMEEEEWSVPIGLRLLVSRAEGGFACSSPFLHLPWKWRVFPGQIALQRQYP